MLPLLLRQLRAQVRCLRERQDADGSCETRWLAARAGAVEEVHGGLARSGSPASRKRAAAGDPCSEPEAAALVAALGLSGRGRRDRSAHSVLSTNGAGLGNAREAGLDLART